MAHQHGYQNVVASSGTAFTKYHLDVLGRFTKNLAFAFDQDSAGEMATKNAIDLAHQCGFEVNIILIPQGKDPDECIRKNPRGWQEAVKHQKEAVDYYLDVAFAGKPKELTSSHKKEIVKEVLPTIAQLGDPVTQAHYIQKLAERLELPEKILYELASKNPQKDSTAIPPLTTETTGRREIEEKLLGIVLVKPEFQSDFFKKINPEDFSEPQLGDIAKQLKISYNQSALFNLTSFKKRIPQYTTKIEILTFPFEKITDSSQLLKEYQEYLKRLINFKTEEIKKFYEAKIREAERSGDRNKTRELIKEFQEKIVGKKSI